MTEQQFTAEPKRISVDELKALLDAGTPVQILDVRAENAYNASNERLPGAIRIPPHDVEATSTLPRDRLTVTYCT